MEQTSGATVLAFVALLSFAIDRVATGALFVLSWSDRWREICPDPAELADPGDKARAQRAERIAYFVVAGVLSVIVFWFVRSGVLAQLGIRSAADGGGFDALLTILILVGGADQVSRFRSSFDGGGTAAAAPEPPVQITGTLVLEEGTLARLQVRERDGDRDRA